MLRIIVVGPPACGKGTQGRKLAATLGLAYLSTGALLRIHMEMKTALGKAAQPLLDRGAYLPDELMIPVIDEWLGAQVSGWLLDGFPRSLPQAIHLEERLSGRGLKLDRAISLEAPFEVLQRRTRARIECQPCHWTGQQGSTTTNRCQICGEPATARKDDDESNFRNRFAQFELITRPVIDHYQAAGLLYACEATGAEHEVAARLLTNTSGITV